MRGVQAGPVEVLSVSAGAQCLPEVDPKGDPKMLKGFFYVLAVKVTAVRRYAEEETIIIVAF